jgi:hypothetical protein
MAYAYFTIASTTLNSPSATVTLSSIPSTYTDLILIISAQGASGASSAINAYFNSDTASNYSYTQVTGDGTTATGARNQDSTRMRLGWSAISSKFAPNVTHIQSYSNTNIYKTLITRINDAAAITGAVSNTWRSTAAISGITFNLNSGANFNTGSTFTLYGIKAA